MLNHFLHSPWLRSRQTEHSANSTPAALAGAAPRPEDDLRSDDGSLASSQLARSALRPPRPRPMPGRSPERRGFELLCMAEFESEVGNLKAAYAAWYALSHHSIKEQLDLDRLLRTPVPGGNTHVLQRVFFARNDLAMAGLLAILPPGEYGSAPRLMARAIGDRTRRRFAEDLLWQHQNFQSGRYLGQATDGDIGGYSAVSFRNGLVYVGDIESGSRPVPPRQALLIGKDWCFCGDRRPLSRRDLSHDAEQAGYVPYFGGGRGSLRHQDGSRYRGIFFDLPHGALVELEDGGRLRLEWDPSLALVLSAEPQSDGATLGAVLRRCETAEQEVRQLQTRVRQLEEDMQFMVQAWRATTVPPPATAAPVGDLISL